MDLENLAPLKGVKNKGNSDNMKKVPPPGAQPAAGCAAACFGHDYL